MHNRNTRGSPFSKMLTPPEAFAEAEYKTLLYGQEGLLEAISQILFQHPHVERLTDIQRMEIAAYARPVFSEIERQLEQEGRKPGK